MNKLREKISFTIKSVELGDMSEYGATEYLIALFQKYTDEVIGENETIEKGLNGGDAIWKEGTRRRNVLRAEQRERIKQIAG
jgi:hypothetical protein